MWLSPGSRSRGNTGPRSPPASLAQTCRWGTGNGDLGRPGQELKASVLREFPFSRTFRTSGNNCSARPRRLITSEMLVFLTPYVIDTAAAIDRERGGARITSMPRTSGPRDGRQQAGDPVPAAEMKNGWSARRRSRRRGRGIGKIWRTTSRSTTRSSMSARGPKR